MKTLKWILSFTVILGAVFVLASCAQTVSAQDDTYVTIDINPSVELIVNKREVVVYVNALNEDAEVLLAELDLVGMPLDEAMDLIIETAIALGYIDVDAEETFVSVSAISKDAEIGDRIRSRVKEHINEAFRNRYMMGRAEDKGFTPEFLAEAEIYGVTPGFLFLAKEAVAVSDELLLEDALLLTVEELQTILKDAKEEMKEVAHALREEFFADRQELYDLYFPQLEAIRTEIATKEAELVTLEDQLLVKQTELAEALEENKATIEAEIVQIEADIALVNEALLTFTSQLEALRIEFHDAVAALRDEFHDASEAIRSQIQEMVQNRRSSFENKINQFFQNHRQNDDEDEEEKERIRTWQNKRP
jgi:hypothetical protein